MHSIIDSRSKNKRPKQHIVPRRRFYLRRILAGYLPFLLLIKGRTLMEERLRAFLQRQSKMPMGIHSKLDWCLPADMLNYAYRKLKHCIGAESTVTNSLYQLVVVVQITWLLLNTDGSDIAFYVAGHARRSIKQEMTPTALIAGDPFVANTPVERRWSQAWPPFPLLEIHFLQWSSYYQILVGDLGSLTDFLGSLYCSNALQTFL